MKLISVHSYREAIRISNELGLRKDEWRFIPLEEGSVNRMIALSGRHVDHYTDLIGKYTKGEVNYLNMDKELEWAREIYDKLIELIDDWDREDRTHILVYASMLLYTRIPHEKSAVIKWLLINPRP